MTETADYDKSATPTAHASTHESGGADSIDNLGPLTGLIISGNGVITWQGASVAESYLFDTRVAGDTHPRFRISAGGRFDWGPGNSATDIYFYRTTVNNTLLHGNLWLSWSNLYIIGFTASSEAIFLQADGDSLYRFTLTRNGNISFGSGAAALDCLLSRRAANILNTPDRFEVGTLGVANSASGTTPGNCQNKAEIFDAAGNSLGFIAIYDAIT